MPDMWTCAMWIKMTKDDIQKAIDEQINPALDMHGGYLLLKEFDEEKKSIKLQICGCGESVSFGM